MIGSYQSDVKSMSDEELHRLSDEIEEAYNVSGDEYCHKPCDDEADARYWEMRREIYRRWELANPEEARKAREYAKTFHLEVLRVLSSKMAFVARVNREFDGAFSSKIGHGFNVRTPKRYQC